MKIIKLLLLALATIGMVVALLMIPRSQKGGGETFGFVSPTANEWKAQIDSLCNSHNWTDDGYELLYSGIHSDYEVGNGELISFDEKNALQRYLFSSSCKMLMDFADSLFMQYSYDDAAVRFCDKTGSCLKSVSIEQNSNLRESLELINEYHSIYHLLFWSPEVKYSIPFSSFGAPTEEEIQKSIRAKKHYASHFSHNHFITEKMRSLSVDLPKLEAEYYMKLADVIIAHHKAMETLDTQLIFRDQIEFSKVCTCAEANERISNYINTLFE